MRSLLSRGLTASALLAGSLFTDLVTADNPIAQDVYTTDPAPVVYNNRLYVFTGHDEDGPNSFFNMKDWRLYSTVDMANYQNHGVVLSASSFSWADKDAWAGQVIPRNGKFYYYVPIHRRGGSMAIGVAVADSITGPYKDALGKPLVENGEIDPTVYIDDNGQAYLYWGNPRLAYVRLNNDMITYSGGVNYVSLTTSGFGTRSGNAQRPTNYEEGPWIYKRNNLWYLVYAANCCSEDIRYSTGPSITGPWTYRGVIMSTQGSSFTNHAGVVDFMGKSYFFYHNGALPGGGGYTRSVCVEPFTYNSDGTIPSLRMTTAGPPQIGTLNPYVRVEAETYAWGQGVEVEAAEGGIAVSFINNGDYLKIRGVAFGTAGASSFAARVSSGASGGKIEIRLDSTSGTLVGTCTVGGTGSWTTYTTVNCAVSGATGTHDLYLRFTGSGTGSLFNFNWWQFTAVGGNPPPPPTTPPPTTPPPTTPPPTTPPPTTPPPPPPTTPPPSGCSSLYGQCGGLNWSGAKCCSQGTCKFSNDWYSQCL